MFACAALLGLRAGEILGLKAENVNLTNRTVSIRQSAWRGKLQTTKNEASENTLPIPAALEGFFREYLKTWKPNPLGLLSRNVAGEYSCCGKTSPKRLVMAIHQEAGSANASDAQKPL
jgi:integrase